MSGGTEYDRFEHDSSHFDSDLLMDESSFVPNLYVLGAAKCGTTTLYAHLARMPDVCMSEPKEPFFFEAEFDKGLDFYRRTYFAHWGGEAITGEARHRNLYLPYVPRRIHEVSPSAKLIVLVRNPVERAFSHWNFLRARGCEELSFPEAISEDFARISRGLRCDTQEEIDMHAQRLGKPAGCDASGLGLYRTYVDSGYYFEQVSRYLDLFPPCNLKIVLFDEMIVDPCSVVSEIVEFLGIDPQRNTYAGPVWANRAALLQGDEVSLHYRIYRSIQRPDYRTAWMRRMIPGALRRFVKARFPVPFESSIDPDTRAWLADHYRERNQRLSRLIGVDLSSWE